MVCWSSSRHCLSKLPSLPARLPMSQSFRLEMSIQFRSSTMSIAQVHLWSSFMLSVPYVMIRNEPPLTGDLRCYDLRVHCSIFARGWIPSNAIKYVQMALVILHTVTTATCERSGLSMWEVKLRSVASVMANLSSTESHWYL